MPVTRPAWTLLQSLDLRICAIEYLRMIERRSSPNQYFKETWQYWLEAYGTPDPADWDEINHYEDHLADYRRRVFRTIKWHALAGRCGTLNSTTRMRRIQRIGTVILDDIRGYMQQGMVFEDLRTLPSNDEVFSGLSILERGALRSR